MALFALYMFEVIYGFAVDHYQERETRGGADSGKDDTSSEPFARSDVRRRSAV